MSPRLLAAGARVLGWLEIVRVRIQPRLDAWLKRL